MPVQTYFNGSDGDRPSKHQLPTSRHLFPIRSEATNGSRLG